MLINRRNTAVAAVLAVGLMTAVVAPQTGLVRCAEAQEGKAREPKLAVPVQAIFLGLGYSQRIHMSTRLKIKSAVCPETSVLRVMPTGGDPVSVFITGIGTGIAHLTLTDEKENTERLAVIVMRHIVPLQPTLGARVKTLILAVNQKGLLRMETKKKLKSVENPLSSIARVEQIASDPTSILLSGRENGLTQLILIDEVGNMEQVVVVVQPLPGGATIVQAGVNHSLRMTSRKKVAKLDNLKPSIARAELDAKDAAVILIQGLKSGSTFLALVDEDGTEEILEVIVSGGPENRLADRTITHGPILGRPGAHEMGVWARMAQPGVFRVRYGLKADQLDQVSRPVTTTLDYDNTGWVRLEGLKANTHYFYQVLGEGETVGPGGSFRTLPDAKDHQHPQLNPKGLFNFRFEAGSCANQGEHSIGPELPLYKTMLARHADSVHFAIMNGDFIYEERREFTPEQWLKQVGLTDKDLPRLVRLAPTITGVWENYKLYLERGKNLAAWHRHVPTFFTFDDHEILNDVYATGTAGTRDRRTVFRDIAVQAWYDYIGWSNPVAFMQGIHFGRAQLKAGGDVLTDSEADFTKLDLKQAANLHVHWGTPTAGVNDVKLDGAGGDPNAGVYDIVEVLDRHRLRLRPAAKADSTASYSIGRRSYYKWRVSNCEFFALDTRTHREKHDFKNPERPGISMIGKEQREWLLDGMAKSDADFFFVISTVPFMIPHVGAGGMAVASDDKDDSWTAFLHERGELIRAWDKLGKPVFVLTGDLHNSFAIKVTDRVWEFCCGPHNSANHPLGSEGNRPPNGPFTWRGTTCDIRWSTFVLDDVPQKMRRRPVYCIVQVNNVFPNPRQVGEERWAAYPLPQVVFQYHDGRTGELLYAEAVRASGK